MDALKMSFKRYTKVLSHIFNILIDSLFQPCDLFEFWLFIMDRISSSLIFNDESSLSVLMVREGKVLVFDNGVHCDAKKLLKSSAFLRSLKSFHHLLTGEVLKVFSYCLESDLIFSSTFSVLLECSFTK